MQPHDWYVIWILGGACGWLSLRDKKRQCWRRVFKYMAAWTVLFAGYAWMRME